jgi:hypothetical protein
MTANANDAEAALEFLESRGLDEGASAIVSGAVLCALCQKESTAHQIIEAIYASQREGVLQ